MALKQSYSLAFEMVWGQYPNKSNKLAGYKSWTKHIAEEDREEFRQHIVKRAQEDEIWNRGERYVPHMSTFINNARWEDNYPRIRANPGFQRRYYDVEEPEAESHTADQAIAKRAIEQALAELKVRH